MGFLSLGALAPDDDGFTVSPPGVLAPHGPLAMLSITIVMIVQEKLSKSPRHRAEGWSGRISAGRSSPGRRAHAASGDLDLRLADMPLYEFECGKCGRRVEELVLGEPHRIPCPTCGSERTRRVFSPLSPPSRQPRGAGVRADESRRREREAARSERLAKAKRRRAAGEL